MMRSSSISGRCNYSKHFFLFGSGHPLDLASRTTPLIFDHEELNNMIRMIKSLEISDLLIKVFTVTFESKVKQQKWGHLSILSAAADANLLRNVLGGNCF